MVERRLCVVVQTVDTNPFKTSNRCVRPSVQAKSKNRSKTLLSGVTGSILAAVFNRKKNCKKVREYCYSPLLLDTSSF